MQNATFFTWAQALSASAKACWADGSWRRAGAAGWQTSPAGSTRLCVWFQHAFLAVAALYEAALSCAPEGALAPIARRETLSCLAAAWFCPLITLTCAEARDGAYRRAGRNDANFVATRACLFLCLYTVRADAFLWCLSALPRRATLAAEAAWPPALPLFLLEYTNAPAATVADAEKPPPLSQRRLIRAICGGGRRNSWRDMAR